MVRVLLLVCLAQLACACTPHEVRCDGRLESINSPAVSRTTAAAAGADSASGVP
jgi:hypothetical protein